MSDPFAHLPDELREMLTSWRCVGYHFGHDTEAAHAAFQAMMSQPCNCSMWRTHSQGTKEWYLIVLGAPRDVSRLVHRNLKLLRPATSYDVPPQLQNDLRLRRLALALERLEKGLPSNEPQLAHFEHGADILPGGHLRPRRKPSG